MLQVGRPPGDVQVQSDEVGVVSPLYVDLPVTITHRASGTNLPLGKMLTLGTECRDWCMNLPFRPKLNDGLKSSL